MDKNRIVTMKTILKKENGAYLYKQNRASAFNTYLESVNGIYYTFHKRNQKLFEGLDKSISDDDKDKIKKSKKLHMFFIHEPMDIPREEIYDSYIIKNHIRDGEAVIFIDILPGRKGAMPKNDVVFVYWSMRDIATEYSSIMSFIYHLITDMFSVVQLHTDSQIYSGNMIVDFKTGVFLTKKMKPTFKPELKKKHEWSALRSILNDRFSSVDSISADPLSNTGVFKAAADDFFLLLRATIFDKYTKYLREDSINSKNRIDTISERVTQAEFGLINDEADKELEEMNDIMNTRLGEVDE